MYYAYNWFWWLFWIVPFGFLLWAIFSWGGGRRYDYRRYGWYDSDYDYDYDPYAYGWGLGRRRGRRRSNHRGRGPRNYQRSDMRVLEDVNDRLLMCDELDASDIEVQVEHGKVALNGRVASRWEKRLAENLADRVAGVIDVDNHLEIGTVGQPHQHTLTSSSTTTTPASTQH